MVFNEELDVIPPRFSKSIETKTTSLDARYLLMSCKPERSFRFMIHHRYNWQCYGHLIT
jgi:hypothetical protein